MKKSLFFIVAAVGLLAAACSSDDNGNKEPTPSVVTINAMTFNLRVITNSDPVGSGHHWTERREHIASMIGIEKPWVIGTQETIVKNQVKWLNENLQGYSGYGISLTGSDENGAVMIYWRNDILTKEESGEFWLSETPDVQGSVGWDADQTRMVTWVKLKHITTGKVFLVFDTHLDHVGVKAREMSIPLIVAKIKEINAEGLPAILLGDFNSNTSNTIFDPLRAYMRDARTNSPVTDDKATFNSWSDNGTSVIDHIFYWGYLKPTVFSVLRNNYGTKYLSDHYPVMCHFMMI